MLRRTRNRPILPPQPHRPLTQRKPLRRMNNLTLQTSISQSAITSHLTHSHGKNSLNRLINRHRPQIRNIQRPTDPQLLPRPGPPLQRKRQRRRQIKNCRGTPAMHVAQAVTVRRLHVEGEGCGCAVGGEATGDAAEVREDVDGPVGGEVEDYDFRLAVFPHWAMSHGESLCSNAALGTGLPGDKASAGETHPGTV